MQDAPLPTEEQLARVREALGAGELRHAQRIEGGLSCTMDVLADGHSRMVLRRYGPWYVENGQDVAARETRALELLQRVRVPAPAPLWIDTEGIFGEPAIIVSFVEGAPDLAPRHPFEWAERLAEALVRIHAIGLNDHDREIFQPGVGEDAKKIQDSPEMILEHPLGESLLRRLLDLQTRLVSHTPVFSHADFWPGNTLWKNGDLRAVIDWEYPATADREMDIAYCSLDIRYLGMDRVADHFVAAYREASGEDLPNLDYWEAVALCRPMPDIAIWVPAWVAMGRSITAERARAIHTETIEAFLERTA
ncbi:MAG: phosphotransferase family protein [Acidimicrobiia bacterium]